MKEVFVSLLFLLLAGGALWEWRFLRESAVTIQDDRPSISDLAKEIPTRPEKEEMASETKEVKDPVSDVQTPPVAVTPKETLEVKALNGGGAKGSAGKAQTALKQAGYVKAAVGNAVGNYTGVTIYYTASYEADANAVQKDLLSTYPSATIKAAPSEKVEEGSAPVVVIIGK